MPPDGGRRSGSPPEGGGADSPQLSGLCDPHRPALRRADHLWTHVEFTQSYKNPVVVLGALSTNGTNPSTTRIRNLTSTGFEARVQEWDYLDGIHVAEAVGFMVMEAGTYTLEDGAQVVAGTSDATDAFNLITFPSTFDIAPVVISQVTSVNDPSAVVSRQTSITTGGFVNWLQEEEAGGTHGTEQISWIAIEPTEDVENSILFESDTTGDVVNQDNFELLFAETYSSAPAFFAQVQSFNGGDANTIRYRELGENGSLIFLEEEASLDAELVHAFENVGYFAFDVGPIFQEFEILVEISTPTSGGSSNGSETSATPAAAFQSLTSGLQEPSENDFDEALPSNGGQQPLTAPQSELAGAVELAEAKVDAAFAELTQEEVEIDSEFFDLL